MTQPIILGTGLNGLVGSRLVKDFSDQYNFDNLDLRDPQRPVDITDYEQVIRVLSASPAKFLIHFAAFTDVTAAWQQNKDTSGLCYKINVEGTKNIVRACQATHKHLIHISTAYVFDGNKASPYDETDAMHPIEWYGETKALAEEVVQSSNIDWTILRIDQPFRSDAFMKLDTLHRILQGLENNQLYPQFTDHTFGPTYINDFVKILDWVIRTKQTGLFHASNGEQWSDYNFALAVKETLALATEVKAGSLQEYLKTLQRPYQKNTALNCQKLFAQLDFKLKSIRQAIQEVER